MKKLKKCTAIVMSAILILASIVPSFAMEEQTDSYEFLLNQGYTTEFLDNLTEESMVNMIELIGDGYVGDINIKQSTLNENTGIERGHINAALLDLNISTGAICQYGTDKINGILVVVTWQWLEKNQPFYRGEDAVTVNWDSSIFSYDADTFSAVDLYKSNEEDEWSVSEEYTSLAASNQGGIGHWTDLKLFHAYSGGTMMFMLKPNAPMIRGTTYKTTINVQYTHEPSFLNGLSLTILDFGIGISWVLECKTLSGESNFEFSR